MKEFKIDNFLSITKNFNIIKSNYYNDKQNKFNKGVIK